MTQEEKSEELYPDFERDLLYQNRVKGLQRKAFVQGAAWKEEQMMEKACEWLKDMACYYSHWIFNGDTYQDEIEVDTEKMIEDFKKAMKG